MLYEVNGGLYEVNDCGGSGTARGSFDSYERDTYERVICQRDVDQRALYERAIYQRVIPACDVPECADPVRAIPASGRAPQADPIHKPGRGV